MAKWILESVKEYDESGKLVLAIERDGEGNILSEKGKTEKRQ